jgi:YVTN family beta-propeller protein
MRYSPLLIGLCALLVSCVSSRPQARSGESGTLVVANMAENTVTVFDLATRKTLATLPTGPAPHEVAVSEDGRTAVVTNYGGQGAPGRTLTVVDLSEPAVTSTIDLGIYERPHGIAFLPGDSLVTVTSEVRGVVALVHIGTGEVVATIPTEQRTSHMLAADARGQRVFTTNIIDGTVTEMDIPGRARLRTIEVAPMVEGITVTPDGGEVWVGSNQNKTVHVVDTGTGTVVATLEDFGFLYRLVITPDARLAVISDPMKGEVRIVDVETKAERSRVTFTTEGVVASAEFSGSPAPEGIALARDGRTAYIAMQGLNQVAAVDLATGTVRAYMDAGAWPDGIGYSPLTR